MKVRDGYLLQKIAGETYLLPYGQNIAEHRRGIRLNESGILLWNALQKKSSEDELFSVLCEHYQPNAKDSSALRQDMQTFLKQLDRLGMLEQPAQSGIFNRHSFAPASFSDCFYFQIGTVRFALYAPKRLVFPSLFDFLSEKCEPEQSLHVIVGLPAAAARGQVLIHTSELMILENEHFYSFLYPVSSGLVECRLTKDGSRAEFYCNPPFPDNLNETLFHAMRFAFLVKAQEMGLFALHSASIRYLQKAWLFSGSSGSGKSTHAALWQELFQVPILNGDLNLLGFKQNLPFVYGSPWCGTSGIYTTGACPAGGIVFLKQAPQNELFCPDADEKQLFTANRLISPAWTKELFLSNLAFAERLTGELPIYRLCCTKEADSAILLKQEIDRISGVNSKGATEHA